MIVLAILATFIALVFSLIVFGANAMSDSSAHQFEGAGMLAAAWLITLALWVAWWVG